MSNHSARVRYAIVGTGARCRMFIDAILRKYAEHAELVALCDASLTRTAVWNDYLQESCDTPAVPAYTADRFDDMIRETKCDVVIVTTMDSTHHTYIIRAMELGCDAVSEKPMTIDAEKAQEILDAVERTGQRLRVTFNYRYMSTFSVVKQVVMSGAIGTPTLVDFQWRLDTSHGADYFRRWHREKKHSGGLLVHKSTHHFDLVNWILDDRPETVFAFGALSFYGETNAKARGESKTYERYHGTAEAAADPFALQLAQGDTLPGQSSSRSKRLYLDAERDAVDGMDGGYIRDRNVFGGEARWPITAEDTMVVSARYRRGAMLNYSLIAYSPWEGERLTISGTHGQVEYFGRGKGHVITGQSDEQLAEDMYAGEKYVRLQKLFEPPEELEIPQAVGGHGGGDTLLLDRVFLPNAVPDPLMRDASHIDGAASILLGVAANQSIETGQSVSVDSLLKLDA